MKQLNPNTPLGARLQAADVPYLTTSQMVEVDRAMIEDFQIHLIQMMENAGRNLAHLARARFLERDAVVLAGTGGNGGGALVCARRLHNWGASVQVFTTAPGRQFSPVPGHQLDILQHMQVTLHEADEPDPKKSIRVQQTLRRQELSNRALIFDIHSPMVGLPIPN